MKINISIVLYKTSHNEIKRIIDICKLIQKDYLNFIYLIDNSPKMGYQDLVDDNVKYFHLPNNPGYGAGHNVAINKSIDEEIPFHLVINSDIKFDYKIIIDMVNFLEHEDDISMLAPYIYSPNGELQQCGKLLPSPLNMFFRAFIPKIFRKSIDFRYELKNFRATKPYQVSYISGAFMMIRTNILKYSGVFDESFFMYPEDIDLTRRIARISKVVINPDFCIEHDHGNATRKSIKMFIIHTYNMFKYFNKWGWIFDSERKTMNKFILNQKALK